MSLATPEQIKEVRRRRTITVMLVVGGILVLLPLSARFGDAGFIIAWVVFALVLTLFIPQYWRCPVCRSPFPRGSNGHRCDECGTEFGA
jgi:hypothetical protein